MSVPEKLVDVKEYHGAGYKPMIDFNNWRVALLRNSPTDAPEKITFMEKHNETDEVFVLLEGKCILFIGDGDDKITKIYPVDMQIGKLYNVKKSCWHTLTTTADAQVLIVENQDTSAANSSYVQLTDAEKKEIVVLTGQTWK